jgi:hypothetical protein
MIFMKPWSSPTINMGTSDKDEGRHWKQNIKIYFQEILIWTKRLCKEKDSSKNGAD